MALSNRAAEFAKPDPNFRIWEVLQNLWCPDNNPSGYVSLGVAENALMHDDLAEHVRDSFAPPTEAFTYGDGGKRLKAAMSKFLTRQLKTTEPILPEHITHTNGCSSAVEHLSWALGNPGDAFLLGQPYYGTFVADLTARFQTQLAVVPFNGVDPLGMAAVQKYEDRIKDAQSKGQRVAGLVISHPHNPLGRCYPKDVLLELMKLCQRYSIHFISDEIYALSVFENKVDTDVQPTPFQSVLSFDTRHAIDPALVHVVWGMSKDFGANGLRLGSIISQHNPTLHASLVPVSLYSSTSLLTEHVTANVLGDDDWVENYIAQNRAKLGAHYEHVTSWAKKHGIEYAPGVNAAFFLWVNLGKAYERSHPSSGDNITETVMDALMDHKIFLASGVVFGSEQPGWFRIVFSQKKEVLEEGLRRIMNALESPETLADRVQEVNLADAN